MLNRLQDVFVSLQDHEIQYVVIGAAGRPVDFEDVQALELDDSL